MMATEDVLRPIRVEIRVNDRPIFDKTYAPDLTAWSPYAAFYKELISKLAQYWDDRALVEQFVAEHRELYSPAL